MRSRCGARCRSLQEENHDADQPAGCGREDELFAERPEVLPAHIGGWNRRSSATARSSQHLRIPSPSPRYPRGRPALRPSVGRRPRRFNAPTTTAPASRVTAESSNQVLVRERTVRSSHTLVDADQRCDSPAQAPTEPRKQPRSAITRSISPTPTTSSKLPSAHTVKGSRRRVWRDDSSANTSTVSRGPPPGYARSVPPYPPSSAPLSMNSAVDGRGAAALLRAHGSTSAGRAPSASLSRVQTFMLITTPTISSLSSSSKWAAMRSWICWKS
jgi:hypothetical protein